MTTVADRNGASTLSHHRHHHHHVSHHNPSLHRPTHSSGGQQHNPNHHSPAASSSSSTTTTTTTTTTVTPTPESSVSGGQSGSTMLFTPAPVTAPTPTMATSVSAASAAASPTTAFPFPPPGSPLFMSTFNSLLASQNSAAVAAAAAAAALSSQNSQSQTQGAAAQSQPPPPPPPPPHLSPWLNPSIASFLAANKQLLEQQQQHKSSTDNNSNSSTADDNNNDLQQLHHHHHHHNNPHHNHHHQHPSTPPKHRPRTESDRMDCESSVYDRHSPTPHIEMRNSLPLTGTPTPSSAVSAAIAAAAAVSQQQQQQQQQQQHSTTSAQPSDGPFKPFLLNPYVNPATGVPSPTFVPGGARHQLPSSPSQNTATYPFPLLYPAYFPAPQAQQQAGACYSPSNVQSPFLVPPSAGLGLPSVSTLSSTSPHPSGLSTNDDSDTPTDLSKTLKEHQQSSATTMTTTTTTTTTITPPSSASSSTINGLKRKSPSVLDDDPHHHHPHHHHNLHHHHHHPHHPHHSHAHHVPSSIVPVAGPASSSASSSSSSPSSSVSFRAPDTTGEPKILATGPRKHRILKPPNINIQEFHPNGPSSFLNSPMFTPQFGATVPSSPFTFGISDHIPLSAPPISSQQSSSSSRCFDFSGSDALTAAAAAHGQFVQSQCKDLTSLRNPLSAPSLSSSSSSSSSSSAAAAAAAAASTASNRTSNFLPSIMKENSTKNCHKKLIGDSRVTFQVPAPPVNSQSHGNSSNSGSGSSSNEHQNNGKSKNRYWGSQYPNYQRGTEVLLGNGSLKPIEQLSIQDFAVDDENVRMQLAEISNVIEKKKGIIRIGFIIGQDRFKYSVDMPIEHPFFVYQKGWSSYSPEVTRKRYSLKCGLLMKGDVVVTVTNKVNMKTAKHRTGSTGSLSSGSLSSSTSSLSSTSGACQTSLPSSSCGKTTVVNSSKVLTPCSTIAAAPVQQRDDDDDVEIDVENE